MATAIDWASVSSIGDGHILNQDRAGMDGRRFPLSDGMGGPAGGHTAATTGIRSFFASGPVDAVSLQRAFWCADQAVRAAGRSRPGEADMGATMTAVVVTDDGLLVASVGDTRCYVSDGTGIRQITTDDTIAAAMDIPTDDARYEKATSVLTRSLGHGPELDVAVQTIPISEATTVILTTDGVHEHVTLDELRHDPCVPLDVHALTVVDRAQRAGSLDDATIVLIAVEP
jgi:serine/threonine protein phosphatase PrpC